VFWQCVLLWATTAHPVINEVLYDPPGPDAGQEFVELFNPSKTSVDLAAARLVFVNGSDPHAAVTFWSGAPGDELPGGGYFVLGGDQVQARDRTIALSLQNGDEAIELWSGGERVDAVAWGGIDLGLGEGRPASEAAGRSLGRVPDGADTDDNATDFRVLAGPSPGRMNLARDDFTLARWSPHPVWREDAGPLRLVLEFVATGWGLHQSAWVEVGPATNRVSAAAGDTARVTTVLECQPGDLSIPVRIGGSPDSTRSILDLPLRCGVDALVITEVQPRPRDPEPEWFELCNRAPVSVSLDGWSVRDRGGRARPLDGDLVLGPAERAVFTADPVRLRAHYAVRDVSILPVDGGWPSLNDSDPAPDAAADSLHLISPRRAVVDLVTWRRADLEDRGRSLQRGVVRAGRQSLWLPATGSPTPGEPSPDESRVWPSHGLVCSPDPFSPDADGLGDELEVLLVGPADGPVARVFDLQGDLVRELALVGQSGRFAARWDGSDSQGRQVPAGAYVVVVEDGQSATGPLRRVVGLGRSR
jgi:hypothetical protein